MLFTGVAADTKASPVRHGLLWQRLTGRERVGQINRHTQAITYQFCCSNVLVKASPRNFIRVKSVRHVSGLSGPGQGTRPAGRAPRSPSTGTPASGYVPCRNNKRERAKRARIRAKPESLHLVPTCPKATSGHAREELQGRSRLGVHRALLAPSGTKKPFTPMRGGPFAHIIKLFPCPPYHPPSPPPPPRQQHRQQRARPLALGLGKEKGTSGSPPAQPRAESISLARTRVFRNAKPGMHFLRTHALAAGPMRRL